MMDLATLRERAVGVVEEAIAALPDDLRAIAEDVAVHFDDVPDADIANDPELGPDLLGLYTGSGCPVDDGVDAFDLIPPQIMLFLKNLWDESDRNLDTFDDEVRVTYLHELGHHFGWDEDDLDVRGLG